MIRGPRFRLLLSFAFVFLVELTLTAQSGPPQLGGPLPGPLPLFTSGNWWNINVASAPVDLNSNAYLNHYGLTVRLHPDFGGDACPLPCTDTYGLPYVTVPSNQAHVPVDFSDGYPDESDGVPLGETVAANFYPIPIEAATEPHWVEGGAPGNVDERASSDRHILVVDRDRKDLFELWNCWYDTPALLWRCGSGAFFDLGAADRRPEGWTSADAAGLAILPGLVRRDEVYGPDEILHAFRVTVANTNGYVWPASHAAGSTAGAFPMGARLRLKASTDISGYPPEMQKIFRAMQTYGLIVADNGSNGYVSGAYDPLWDNDVLNPAFHSLHFSDFEVIQLGWPPANLWRNTQVTSLNPITPPLSQALPLDSSDLYLANVSTEMLDPEPVLNDPSKPLIFYQLDAAATLEIHLRKAPGGYVQMIW